MNWLVFYVQRPAAMGCDISAMCTGLSIGILRLSEGEGDFILAYFTNEHAACYLLTQKQLRNAIQSGGFLVSPHEGPYDLLCTAATDPYTQCGFKKMICISHLEDFIVPHLSSKYAGKLGVGDKDFLRQIESLYVSSVRDAKPLLCSIRKPAYMISNIRNITMSRQERRLFP